MDLRAILKNSLLAALCLGVLCAGPFTSGSAFADEPEGAEADQADAVSRLTDAERERLERSAMWDGLDESRRQKVASAVIRMRDMTPEDRKRFAERIERYQSARRRSHDDDLPARMRDWRAHGKRHHRRVHALARGAAEVGLAKLPKETRRKFREWGAVRGREIAFYRMLLETAAEPYAKGARAFDLTLVPESHRARMQKMIEKADDRTRGRIAYMYVSRLATSVLDGLPRPLSEKREPASPAEQDSTHGKLMRAYYRTIGERLAERFPEAFAAVIKRVGALEDEKAAKAVFESYGRPLHHGHRGFDQKQRVAMYVSMLLDAPQKMGSNAEARAEITGFTTPFLRYLLVEQAKVPVDDVDAALALEPELRRRRIQELLRERGYRMRGGRGQGGRNARGDGGAQGGRPARGPGPGGARRR